MIAEARVGVGGAEAIAAPHRRGRSRCSNGQAPGDDAFRAAAEAAAEAIDPLEDHPDRRPNTGAIWCAPCCAARWSAVLPMTRATPKAPAPNGSAARSAGWKTRRWSPARAASPPICRHALGALRAQPGRRRPHREHHSARRRDGHHRRRSQGVKPIRPMLHKFNYMPVGQPILADGVVRFVGEPIAAVVAASKEEAEDIADQVEVDIDETTPRDRCARRACRPARRWSMPKRPAMSSSKASHQDARASTRSGSAAHKVIKVDARSHRQNATPMEARAGHAAYDAATGRVTLTCTTQMPHLTRTAIADMHRHAGVRSARDRARCRRRLRAENVAGAGICRCWCGWRGNCEARWPGPKTGAKT